MEGHNFENLNERKRHYRTFDDDIANLKKYYNLDDHEELLQFLKKNRGIKGDIAD
jgi:hypothetical protein